MVSYLSIKVFKFPSVFSECHKIDVIDCLVWEIIANYDSNDFLERCILNDNTTSNENPKVPICARFLEASPQVPATLVKLEALMMDDKPLSNEACTPKLELEPLTSFLRYEFLDLILHIQ